MISKSTFPFAAVLELLELGAALDRHARANGGSARELAELTAVALDLVEALDLAQRSERGIAVVKMPIRLAWVVRYR